MKKSIFLECVISGLGAILYALGWILASANLAIPYLFAVFSTIMVHNTTALEIIGEYKKYHTWKGNTTIRKDLFFLISMLIIYWIIIFIFIRAGLIKT